MSKRVFIPRVCALLLTLSLHNILSAQSAPTLQTLTDALKLRSDMADGIVHGSEKPAAALIRLQAQVSPSGLKLDAVADFGFAAIDIGHRLIAAGKPGEAGLFYQAAETSLLAVLNRTPDTQAQPKAQYLQALALLHGQHLNNPSQARLDIEQAIALQPDDKYLQSVRDNLARENAEHFKSQPKS